MVRAISARGGGRQALSADLATSRAQVRGIRCGECGTPAATASRRTRARFPVTQGTRALGTVGGGAPALRTVPGSKGLRRSSQGTRGGARRGEARTDERPQGGETEKRLRRKTPGLRPEMGSGSLRGAARARGVGERRGKDASEDARNEEARDADVRTRGRATERTRGRESSAAAHRSVSCTGRAVPFALGAPAASPARGARRWVSCARLEAAAPGDTKHGPGGTGSTRRLAPGAPVSSGEGLQGSSWTMVVDVASRTTRRRSRSLRITIGEPSSRAWSQYSTDSDSKYSPQPPRPA